MQPDHRHKLLTAGPAGGLNLMPTGPRWLVRGPAAAGLAVSAALLADGLRLGAAYCARGGCAAVAGSAWGTPLGVPLPTWGAAAFGGLLVLSLLDRTRRAVPAAAGVAAACGAGLLAVQVFVLRAVCPACLLADAAGLLCGAGALLSAPAWRSDVDDPAAATAGGWAVLAAALCGPLMWAALAPPPPVPAPVRSALAETPPGAVTVAAATDPTCPHCRATARGLLAWIDLERDAGRTVRAVHLPVVRPAVPGSADACRLLAAAEDVGHDAATRFLAAVPADAGERLTDAALRTAWAAARLSAAEFDAALAAPLPPAEWATDAAVPGLPTVWVGTAAGDPVRLVGPVTPAGFAGAAERAGGW